MAVFAVGPDDSVCGRAVHRQHSLRSVAPRLERLGRGAQDLLHTRRRRYLDQVLREQEFDPLEQILEMEVKKWVDRSGTIILEQDEAPGHRNTGGSLTKSKNQVAVWLQQPAAACESPNSIIPAGRLEKA